jgi:hypothetical protein
MSLKWIGDRMLGIDRQHEKRRALSLEQIQAFLKASEEFRFEASKRREIYEWVTRTLVEHEYTRQPREGKGVLRRTWAR